MDKRVAETAAHWWADFLRHAGPMDNGELGMVAIMGKMAQKQALAGITPEQADVFEACLVAVLEPLSERYTTVGVDYHPDGILQDAAKRAGIDVDYALPWKTMMWIESGKISVAVGYGARATPPEG